MGTVFYRGRDTIKYPFNCLKDFRGITTGHGRLSTNFLAATVAY